VANWSFSDQAMRAMYRGGKANATARRLSRLWATVFGWGLQPRRWVTLEVPGRCSGRTTRFPLGMAQSDGQWYLVSMLGDDCNWVKNVRAAGGKAILRRRHAQACNLIEVPLQERAHIIKRYLAQVPGARPHIPVDRRSPISRRSPRNTRSSWSRQPQCKPSAEPDPLPPRPARLNSAERTAAWPSLVIGAP